MKAKGRDRDVPQSLDELSALARHGGISRREFISRATAFGLSLSSASALLAACTAEPATTTEAMAASTSAAPTATSAPTATAAPATTAAQRSGGVIRVAVSSFAESDDVDPARGGTQFQGVTDAMLYDTLVEYEQGTWEVRAGLADEWEVSPDNRTWTFRLRDVQWHDGKPLRAEDVAWTYQRILDESIGAALQARLASVMEPSGIEVVDESTLRLNLSGPDPFLPLVLGQRDARIIQEGQGQTTGQVNGVGTGPFRLVSLVPGQSSETEWNPDYWNGAPQLDGVQVIVIPDEATKIESVISGDSHYTDPNPLSILPVVEAAGDSVRIDFSEDVRMMNVALQQDVDPFTDNRVRDAFKFAIDRQRLVDVAALGRGSWTADIPVVNFDPYFPPSLMNRAQDLEMARSLLSDAGYPNGLDLTLDTTDLNGQSDFAVVFAEMVAEAGIRIAINNHPAGEFNANVWLQRPMYTQGAWSRRHPNEILALTLMQGGAFNEPRWDDPTLTELVGAARATSNTEEQIALFHQALELVANNSGWIVPYFYDVPYVSKPELQGVGLEVVTAPNFHRAFLA